MITLIENSFALTARSLKKDLRKARRNESAGGSLSIAQNGKPFPVDYWIEHDGKDSYLVVTFGVESQRILLSEYPVTFGTRTYLTCQCGRRTSFLYLQNGTFACRRCQKLRYQSTTINKTTKHGRFLYKQSQILKLVAKREEIDRIFWRSNYTKKFTKWLDMCDRVGLTDQVKSASELMMAINNQAQRV